MNRSCTLITCQACDDAGRIGVKGECQLLVPKCDVPEKDIKCPFDPETPADWQIHDENVYVKFSRKPE